MVACQRGRIEIITALLEHGADMYMRRKVSSSKWRISNGISSRLYYPRVQTQMTRCLYPAIYPLHVLGLVGSEHGVSIVSSNGRLFFLIEALMW